LRAASRVVHSLTIAWRTMWSMHGFHFQDFRHPVAGAP